MAKQFYCQNWKCNESNRKAAVDFFCTGGKESRRKMKIIQEMKKKKKTHIYND